MTSYPRLVDVKTTSPQSSVIYSNVNQFGKAEVYVGARVVREDVIEVHGFCYPAEMVKIVEPEKGRPAHTIGLSTLRDLPWCPETPVVVYLSPEESQGAKEIAKRRETFDSQRGYTDYGSKENAMLYAAYGCLGEVAFNKHLTEFGLEFTWFPMFTETPDARQADFQVVADWDGVKPRRVDKELSVEDFM